MGYSILTKEHNNRAIGGGDISERSYRKQLTISEFVTWIISSNYYHIPERQIIILLQREKNDPEQWIDSRTMVDSASRAHIPINDADLGEGQKQQAAETQSLSPRKLTTQGVLPALVWLCCPNSCVAN